MERLTALLLTDYIHASSYGVGTRFTGPPILQSNVPKPQRTLFPVETHVPRLEGSFYLWEHKVLGRNIPALSELSRCV